MKQKKKIKMAFHKALVLTGALLVSGCTEGTNLIPFAQREDRIPTNNKIQVHGRLCTQTPGQFPLTTLHFMIADNSGSTEDGHGGVPPTDRTFFDPVLQRQVTQRQLAYRDILTQKLADEDPNWLTKVVQFADDSYHCPRSTDPNDCRTTRGGRTTCAPRGGGSDLSQFINPYLDFAEIDMCAAEMIEGHDETNMRVALQDTLNALDALTQSLSRRELVRTSFVITFISDGIPYNGSGSQGPPWAAEEDPDGLYELLQDIMALVGEDQYRNGRLDSVFLTGGWSPADPLYQIAEEILQNFALIGGGQFLLVQDASNIDFSSSVDTVLEGQWDLRNFYFRNESVVHKNGEVLPDVDRDGIDDLAEAEVGLDPFNNDTDNDCLDDGIELLLGRDPHLRDPGCEGGFIDTDGDGLNDYVEDLVGSDFELPDTDGDGIDDRTEVLAGTNPRRHDTEDDPDGDGVRNGDEIRRRTDPLLPNSPEDEAAAYEIEIVDQVTTPDQRECIDYEINNISLVETGISADMPPSLLGVNRLSMFYAENPSAIPEDRVGSWRTGTFSAIYFKGEKVVPDDGRMQIDGEDLQQI